MKNNPARKTNCFKHSSIFVYRKTGHIFIVEKTLLFNFPTKDGDQEKAFDDIDISVEFF